jgi:hypothetical protein
MRSQEGSNSCSHRWHPTTTHPKHSHSHSQGSSAPPKQRRMARTNAPSQGAAHTKQDTQSTRQLSNIERCPPRLPWGGSALGVPLGARASATCTAAAEGVGERPSATRWGDMQVGLN